MKLHWFVIAALSLFVACSGSKKQEKTDSMTDEEYGEAMEEEHADETPEPSGAENQEGGDADFAGKDVEYGAIEGEKVTGYFAVPATEGPHPGVILIHEWWGLNDNIKTMADKLASKGYAALAVDMYGGDVATTPDDAKQYMQRAMASRDEGVANLEMARKFLEQEGSEKIGVIGWCFGGGWALEAGLTQGEKLDAVVMYYGRVKTKQTELEGLQAPLLGVFGAEDQGIPVEQVKTFEKALDAAGKDATIRLYDGAGHAFANPSGERYVKEAAEDAWSKTLTFFRTHLKG